MSRFLEMKHIGEILQDQLARYGGEYGIRDVGLTESAVATPHAQFGGELLHADPVAQAAAYLFHLCSNHPYLDGNKRVALASAMILKSCARDPSRRYQSVDEILVDLYPLIEAFDLNVQSRPAQKNQMTHVSILHEEAQQEDLDRMLMKFKKRLEEKGMQMKISGR